MAKRNRMGPEQQVRFLSIAERGRLTWPDGCRVAVWVCPNLEHYDYCPPLQRQRDPWPRMPHPDVLGYGEKDYGNRVGVWRLFELLDKHGIRATVSGGLTCFDRYKEILAGCVDRDWDCMCHGFENTSYLWDMPEDEERKLVQEACSKYMHLFGRPMTGWFSPAASHTELTLDLLTEAGIRYFCDWYHDDQPFPIFSNNGVIITLPYTMEFNDVIVRLQGQEADDFVRMIRDAFATLWYEGAEQGRVLCIALHSYVSGQPHWIAALDLLLGELKEHEKVWWTTGAEMAEWYYQTAFNPILQQLNWKPD